MLLKSDVDVKNHLRGWFVEQTLVLSSSFRCEQIHDNQSYESEAEFLVVFSPSMNEL
jgi:hypothetical protein